MNQVAFVALSMVRGVGSGTLRNLIRKFNTELTSVFYQSEQDLAAILRTSRTPDYEGAAREIKENSRQLVTEAKRAVEAYADRGIQILIIGDPAYPEPLYDLESPPEFLFVEGNVTAIQDQPIVAVVGTREPTPEGLVAARSTCVELARKNVTILSGLALGIDAVAHRTAIDFGAPTVAVLGNGLDVIFPSGTSRLRQEITQFGGAVVSEYLPNETYSRDKFVARNRIQAGLSNAVCIVQGRSKSGTAHTVRFAKSTERKLFGVLKNGYCGSEQEELLYELLADNKFVFDVADKIQLKSMLEYVGASKKIRRGKNVQPRLFANTVRDIRELAILYDATTADLNWLCDQIDSIKTERVKKRRITNGRKSGTD